MIRLLLAALLVISCQRAPRVTRQSGGEIRATVRSMAISVSRAHGVGGDADTPPPRLASAGSGMDLRREAQDCARAVTKGPTRPELYRGNMATLFQCLMKIAHYENFGAAALFKTQDPETQGLWAYLFDWRSGAAYDPSELDRSFLRYGSVGR